MPSCLPSCAKNKDKAQASQPINKPDSGMVTCGICGTQQTVPSNGSVFVCVSCHSVNRLKFNDLGERRVSVVSPGTDDIALVRTSSTIFQVDSGAADSSLSPEVSAATQNRSYDPEQLPQCSVCLDGAGDIVLLPCSHGGLCEECARHIAQNMAVGGSHCPRCREPIERLVRISNLRKGIAHATDLVIAPADVRKAPPKVPPPPGHKKKNAAMPQRA